MHKLSTHFTLAEFLASGTAIRKGISNVPKPTEILNIIKLCENTLEPIRTLLNGLQIRISSGYRCEALNKAVGGAKGSQHVLGQAADFHVCGMDIEEAYKAIINSGIPYDQCILEFGSWIHISYREGCNRREALVAVKSGGKTVYKPFEKG